MAIMGQHMQDQYAEALEACTICLMSKEDVLNLLFTDARIAARIAEILSQRLLDMELRLSGLALKSLPQRVAETLLRFEQATRRPTRLFRPTRHEVAVTHEQLAEFVGTYRETMTKTLHELREQGLIELRRGKIVLLDLEGLKSLAAG
jgi:CRP-like cAMP-binding protein